ncbi:MAG: TetR/AcrR family transcriptional regulator [Paludibacter sp.]|nr:TetR/AcrR family transcriptional regulator [Paludibacter sp.]
MKLTKKQQVELKAKELFWKYGFKKVTIDEICKKANVSRKTFYTFYDNKSALVIFLLQQMIDESMTDYQDIIDEDATFSDKMEKMLALKYKSTNQFSMEFVADFFHPDSDDILAFYTKIVQDSLTLTNDFFREAQKNGEMNQDLDINFVMLMMQKMVEIGTAPEVMALFSDAETMKRQLSQFVIYGVMPVKPIHN